MHQIASVFRFCWDGTVAQVQSAIQEYMYKSFCRDPSGNIGANHPGNSMGPWFKRRYVHRLRLGRTNSASKTLFCFKPHSHNSGLPSSRIKRHKLSMELCCKLWFSVHAEFRPLWIPASACKLHSERFDLRRLAHAFESQSAWLG